MMHCAKITQKSSVNQSTQNHRHSRTNVSVLDILPTSLCAPPTTIFQPTACILGLGIRLFISGTSPRQSFGRLLSNLPQQGVAHAIRGIGTDVVLASPPVATLAVTRDQSSTAALRATGNALHTTSCGVRHLRHKRGWVDVVYDPFG